MHHLADSEMTSAIRLRRLIAEEQPVIVGYDEAEWARRLHYDDRPIGPSLDALAAARSTTADILDRLTDAEWGRVGTHTESGAYGVERWLEIYAAHAHEHADQIRRRARGVEADRERDRAPLVDTSIGPPAESAPLLMTNTLNSSGAGPAAPRAAIRTRSRGRPTS